MKLITTTAVLVIALSVAACHTLKKSGADTVAVPAAPATPVVPVATPKPKDGVFAPGSEELAAIRARYADVSMATLREGYTLYTGVCTNCHMAKSIYARPEDKWKGIIDDMAVEARITPAQKDAVYKYVLAVKGTQAR